MILGESSEITEKLHLGPSLADLVDSVVKTPPDVEGSHRGAEVPTCTCGGYCRVIKPVASLFGGYKLRYSWAISI